MILHLFNDEKVVNRCVETFEKVFPGGNIFVCFVNGQIKWVKPHLNLYFCDTDESFDANVLGSVTQVIIHYLDPRKISFVQKYIPKNIPCTWMVWGGDLYNNILAEMGYSLYYEPRFLGKVYLRILLNRFLYKLGIGNRLNKLYLDFIKERIALFSTRTDYSVMKEYIGNYLNGRQVSGFSYYPIDSMLGDLKDSSTNGPIILVGNSGGFTNNHLYAFNYLSKLNVGNREVITPMGYGGTLKYRTHVEKHGKKIWGEAYKALNSFIPLDEYNRMMVNADICIYSSWRQEAFGNIVVALYLGAKVFLSERSSLVDYFKSVGIKVYVLEKMTQEDLDTPLTDEIKDSNRKIIYELLNEQSILASIKRIWGNPISNSK